MARRGQQAEVESQAGTPSGGNPRGADVQTATGRIESMLDDDGHVNPNPGQLSRAHPDYVEGDEQLRDDTGRFKSASREADDTDDGETGEIEDNPNLDTDDDSDDEPNREEAADTDDTDADGEQSDASDDTQTDDADTDSDAAIDSLEALAGALEITVDDLKGQVSHSFKSAGEDVTVTLAEMEQGYQRDADYRRSTAQLAEYRRGAEIEFSQRFQAYEQQFQVMAEVMNASERLIAADIQSPQMAALRDAAPDEWTARQHELGQRVTSIQQMRQQAAGAFEQFRNQNLNVLRQNEAQALQNAIPEFGEQHAALAKEVIGSLGYAPQEIRELFDHRMIRGALELGALRKKVAEQDAQIAKASETAKRVKRDLPKLVKPGKHTAPGTKGKQLKRDNVRKLQGRLRKSGSVDDAAAVIETMFS